MSKVIPIALAAHYATRWHTVCMCLKVTLPDTTVVGWTNLSRALPVAGVAYTPTLQMSGISSSDMLSVDNLDLTVLPSDGISLDDLRTGRWRDAKFEVFEVNYVTPTGGINVIKRGTVGELHLRRGQYVLEFLGLTQSLQQTQGQITQKTCRNRLGDALCTIDLAPFTYTGVLTAVVGPGDFSDTARAEDGAWFADGLITFNTGDNAGFTQKVKFFADGQFQTSLPFPNDPQIGDEYTAIAGCRKRLEEDCVTKYDNAYNMNAEPDLIGIDDLTQPDSARGEQPADMEPSLPLDLGGDSDGGDGGVGVGGGDDGGGPGE